MISETALYIGKSGFYFFSSSSGYYCCLGLELLENILPNIFFTPRISFLVLDVLLSDDLRSFFDSPESLRLLFLAYTSFFKFSALFWTFSLSSSVYVGFIFNVLIMRLIHSNKPYRCNR